MRLRKAVYITAASMVLLSLLAACVAPLVSKRPENKATIQLQAVPERGAYRLKKTGRLVCTSAKPEGCIKVPKGDTATVTFKLNASPDWHLTKFTLCRQSGGDPCKLSLPERADFGFTADGTGDPMYPDEHGEVDLTQLDADLQQFVLKDNNIVEQNYEYTVEACKKEKGDDLCTTLDPPLDNEGLL